MFEDFTFLSMSSNISAASPSQSRSGYTSESVSPHTSRPSSPNHQGRGSRYYHYHDDRYYHPPSPPKTNVAATSRNTSVTALTSRFRDYSINGHAAPSSPTSPPTKTRHTSSSSSLSSLPSSAYASTTSFTPPTPPPNHSSFHWDIHMADRDEDRDDLPEPPLLISSPPPPSSMPSSSYQSLPTSLLRRQRQTLVRLQCLAQSAPGLAMLMEECHPSDLPLLGGGGGGGGGAGGKGSPTASRRGSLTSAATVAGTGNGARVEKRSSGGSTSSGSLSGGGKGVGGTRKEAGRKGTRKRGTC